MTTKPVTCTDCPAPIAKLVRGDDGVVRLVIVARHHSSKHVNEYTKEQLIALWRDAEEGVE